MHVDCKPKTGSLLTYFIFSAYFCNLFVFIYEHDTIFTVSVVGRRYRRTICKRSDEPLVPEVDTTETLVCVILSSMY